MRIATATNGNGSRPELAAYQRIHALSRSQLDDLAIILSGALLSHVDLCVVEEFLDSVEKKSQSTATDQQQPLELWISFCAGFPPFVAFETQEDAQRNCHGPARTVHMREVTQEDAR